mmetsp:Transcript_24119/g.47919  ORF Transcript_24119/g.47919 Transcript_24119/m.47919 type:complete len:537 (+) Transcript_24119:136-1746(+)
MKRGTTPSPSSGGRGPHPLTDGWLELFLTPSQKAGFARWDEVVSNRSVMDRFVFDAVWSRMAAIMPDSVAPNVLTLVGLGLMLNAWYVMNLYGEDYPTGCTWFACVSTTLFFITSSLDMKHADRIRQRTSLGELWKYNCDCCSCVFLALLTVYSLGGIRVSTQWYAVQAFQLVLFTKHLSAFHRNDGLRHGPLSGPGDVISFILIILAVRASFGLEWIIAVYGETLHKLVETLEARDVDLSIPPLAANIVKAADPVWMGAELVRTAYIIMYGVAVVKSLGLKTPHGWSRFGIFTALLMRSGPAILIHTGLATDYTVLDVICDGLFMAVLTSDITLAKMAGREIHPWVVVMSMATLFSHAVILALVLVYYIAVFGDLCNYQNMPLLTVCRNVYCDGVYDLCHIGHKNAFREALRFGNRLFVGVVGDADASSYKRPPIMTSKERCNEVEACKSVTKVIPDAPCFGLDQEFLDRHQIHVVAFGEEYLEKYPNPDDDIYYGYVRKLGIARPLPRTQSLSTSDLIRRIQKARPADDKNSPT